jgi:hypothetical protein
MEDGGLNQLKIKNYELKDSLNCDNKQTELFHAYN